MAVHKRGDLLEVSDGGFVRVINPHWPLGDEPFCERVDEDTPGPVEQHRDEWVSYCSHVNENGLQDCHCAPDLLEVVEEYERLRQRIALLTRKSRDASTR
jgi:hypothetical protein